jgi:hypothetical protein
VQVERCWDGTGDDERSRSKAIEVFTEVLAGRRTVVSAAGVLALGVRQTSRLLATSRIRNRLLNRRGVAKRGVVKKDISRSSICGIGDDRID